jgi:hypothetical protein
MEIDGKPVVNAKSKLPIKVTDRNIKLGAAKDSGGCAIVKACQDLPGVMRARVHLKRTYLEYKKEWIRYDTPIALRSELIAFDRGGSFEPGDYELRPLTPAEQKRFGRRQGSRRGDDRASQRARQRRTKPMRQKPHVVHGVRERGANR